MTAAEQLDLDTPVDLDDMRPIGLEPEISIDLDRPEAGDITEGPHPFYVGDATLSDAPGGSGYHYFRITWLCLSKGCYEQPLWENLSLSPQAKFRLDAFFDAIRAPRTGRITSVAQFREVCLDRQAWIDVVMEEYQGDDKPRVGKYLQGEPVDFKPRRQRLLEAAEELTKNVPAFAPKDREKVVLDEDGVSEPKVPAKRGRRAATLEFSEENVPF